MNPNYKTFRYNLSPGQTVDINRSATFISCLEASHPFGVSLDNQAESDFEAGITFREDEPFNLIQLRNPSTTETLQVQVSVGMGDVRDARFTIGEKIDVEVKNAELPVRVQNSEMRVRVANQVTSVRLNQKADVELKNTFMPRERVPEVFQTNNPQTFAPGARGTLVAAHALRREVIVTNDGVKRVFLCGINSSVSGYGMPLEAGQSVTLKTTAAIYVRNEEDTPAKVHFCELRWS